MRRTLALSLIALSFPFSLSPRRLAARPSTPSLQVTDRGANEVDACA